MANTYRISRLPADTDPAVIDWTAIPSAAIDTYRWLEGYAPAATAQMVYIEGNCFALKMTCHEDSPRAVYHGYNDPVYTDSCLEFFSDWLGDGRYVNLEMNANGALLSCVGVDRHDRTPIRDLNDGQIFPVKANVEDGVWSVYATIPCAYVAAILEVEALPFAPGYTFRGNFYKCGDETAIPHYGMWNPVGTANPDFHCPAYFGNLVID